MWHVTCTILWRLKIFSKLKVPSFYGFGTMIFKLFGGNGLLSWWMNISINQKLQLSNFVTILIFKFFIKISSYIFFFIIKLFQNNLFHNKKTCFVVNLFITKLICHCILLLDNILKLHQVNFLLDPSLFTETIICLLFSLSQWDYLQ